MKKSALRLACEKLDNKNYCPHDSSRCMWDTAWSSGFDDCVDCIEHYFQQQANIIENKVNSICRKLISEDRPAN